MATSVFREYFRGYEILGELGRGNARVLKAKNLLTGELVAIKHFAFNTDADTLRRFQRESEIMKSIEHHCIVKILEVHLDAELPYIVMQLIEGGDLRSLLRAHKILDIYSVIALGNQITEALSAIHDKSIVHRDIKPENIMYRKLASGETQFLLTDFGIARLREQADSITVTGSSMLTYDYASPEQFSQPKMVNAATDYYSLGIVLYECITGNVPFEYEHEDLLLHINRVISAPLPAPFSPGEPLPAAMLQLLEGLCRKQPSMRLSDPVSVFNLLSMAETGTDPGPAQMPHLSIAKTISYARAEPANPPGRRLAFTGVVLLLLCIAVLFSWTKLSKHPVKPGTSTANGNTTTQLVETRHELPTEAAHVVHQRHTPLMQSDHKPADYSNTGIALTNGMYYNDFDTEDSAWSTGKDDNSEFILLDGKYTMKGFNDTLNYSSFIKLNMDTDKDFTIAASAAHEGPGSSDPFGIIFCGDDSRDAFMVFYLTSNGYYSIGSSIKDEWNVLADWTASSGIRQDAEMNIMTIERRNGLLRFLVNGRLEKILPFDGGFGKYFGLRVDGAQTVSFDQFIVKGSSPVNNRLH